MGKATPDATLDASLDYVAGSDTLCICTTEPTTEAEAYTTNMLARVALAGGDFTKANDVSGRKVTIGAKAGVPITNSGNAQHVALVNHVGGTIRLITTCTIQALVAGGTVDVPAWKFNISDPI